MNKSINSGAMEVVISKNFLQCPWAGRKKDFSSGIFTKEEKTYIIWRIESKLPKITKWLTKHKIDRSLAYKWARNIHMGFTLHNQPGKPKYIDEIGDNEIKKKLQDLASKGKPMPRDELPSLIQSKASESFNRRNIHNPPTIDNSYINNYIEKSNLCTVNAQKTTKVRFRAENSIYNCISTIFMWYYIIKYVVYQFLVLNYDSTQFEIFCSQSKSVSVVVTEEYRKNAQANRKPISTTETNNSLAYFVKYFSIVSLSGLVYPHYILLLADENLGENDFKYYKVPGLCNVNTMEGFGYLCFTKTRCGNDAFFKWLNKDILIPYIVALRDRFGISEDNAAFITCDGEYVQIAPWLTEEMKILLKKYNLLIAKLCASTTAVTQANDAWKLFLRCKANIQHVTNDDILSMNFLYQQLEIAFNKHKLISKDILKHKSKENILNGIIRCVITITKSCSSQIIVNSFKKVGIEKDLTVNVLQVLNQFNQDYTIWELTNIYDNIDFGVNCYVKRGRMTDEEIETLEIVKKNIDTTENIPKDQQTICHERGNLLSHPDTINRFLEKQQAKADALIEAANRKEEKKRKKEEQVNKDVVKGEKKQNKKQKNENPTNNNNAIEITEPGII